MDNLPAISVAVCLAGLAIVFLLSIFALRHIVVWARQRASNAYRPLDHSYHDADGEATELSMQTASKPVLRLAITASVAVGELASLAQAIFTIPGYYPCYACRCVGEAGNMDTSSASVCCIVCPIFLHSPLLCWMEDRTELFHHFVSALHRGLCAVFRQFPQLVANNTGNSRDCFWSLDWIPLPSDSPTTFTMASLSIDSTQPI